MENTGSLPLEQIIELTTKCAGIQAKLNFAEEYKNKPELTKDQPELLQHIKLISNQKGYMEMQLREQKKALSSLFDNFIDNFTDAQIGDSKHKLADKYTFKKAITNLIKAQFTNLKKSNAPNNPPIITARINQLLTEEKIKGLGSPPEASSAKQWLAAKELLANSTKQFDSQVELLADMRSVPKEMITAAVQSCLSHIAFDLPTLYPAYELKTAGSSHGAEDSSAYYDRMLTLSAEHSFIKLSLDPDAYFNYTKTQAQAIIESILKQGIAFQLHFTHLKQASTGGNTAPVQNVEAQNGKALGALLATSSAVSAMSPLALLT